MRMRSFLALMLAALPSGGVTAAAGTLTIGWNDLRPADGAASTTAAAPVSVSETLSWNLKGKTIQLVGYALPSDREGDLVYQFLLVPWTGACSHMPPPPANQTVLITLKNPYKLKEAYETVSVTGVLEPELDKTQLFIVDGVTVVESGYRVAGAQVAPADKVIGASPRPASNPWGFIKK